MWLFFQNATDTRTLFFAFIIIIVNFINLNNVKHYKRALMKNPILLLFYAIFFTTLYVFILMFWQKEVKIKYFKS